MSDEESLFANDGNFLERFKKIQDEQKKKEEQEKELPKPENKGPTLPLRRKQIRPQPFASKKPKGAKIQFGYRQSLTVLWVVSTIEPTTSQDNPSTSTGI